jgi:homoaconitase/3-isopropylmalate dehydratase large subunit
LQPVLAVPNSPDNIVNVLEHIGRHIDYAFIGTCTNGRLEDLQTAAKILRGGKIPSHVRFVIAPASKQFC